MKITRRRWLAAAAGTGASALLPFTANAAPATPATIFPPSNDSAARAAAGTPRLCFGAGAQLPGLRDAIRSVAASYGIAAIDEIELPVLSSHEAPRLDALVEQLRALRGTVLLGAVGTRHAICFDEALLELGAAWLHRGEHAMTDDRFSRHRLMRACQGLHEVDIRCTSGWSHLPEQQWQALLGTEMAIRALAPQLAADKPVFVAQAKQPSCTHDAFRGTSASTRSESFLSFVTRI